MKYSWSCVIVAVTAACGAASESDADARAAPPAGGQVADASPGGAGGSGGTATAGDARASDIGATPVDGGRPTLDARPAADQGVAADLGVAADQGANEDQGAAPPDAIAAAGDAGSPDAAAPVDAAAPDAGPPACPAPAARLEADPALDCGGVLDERLVLPCAESVDAWRVPIAFTVRHRPDPARDQFLRALTFTVPADGVYSFLPWPQDGRRGSLLLSLRETCGDPATERAAAFADFEPELQRDPGLVTGPLLAGSELTLVVRDRLPNTAYDLHVLRADADAPPAIVGDVEGWRVGEPPSDFIQLRVAGEDPNGDVPVALAERFFRGVSLGREIRAVNGHAPPARTFSSVLAVELGGADAVRVSFRDSVMNESDSVLVRLVPAPVPAAADEACDPDFGSSACVAGHRCHDDGVNARPRCVPLSPPIIDAVVATIDEDRLLLRVDGRDADADVDFIDRYGVDRFGDRTIGGVGFVDVALSGRTAFSARAEGSTDWLPLAERLECVVRDAWFLTGVGSVDAFPAVVYRQRGEACDPYEVESLCVTAVGCAPTADRFVCE